MTKPVLFLNQVPKFKEDSKKGNICSVWINEEAIIAFMKKQSELQAVG